MQYMKLSKLIYVLAYPFFQSFFLHYLYNTIQIMSNKIHMDKNNKNKCSIMLKKIFGSNFYFVHGSKSNNLESILESGKIKISTEVDDKYINFGGYEFIYCWIKYDDIHVTCRNGGFWNSFFISPIILLNEDVIFNSKWLGGPIQKEELTNTKVNHIINSPYDSKKEFKEYQFSVYLNKNDSNTLRLKKLKKIKKYLLFYSSALPEHLHGYSLTHEFLFPNEIDLKKYLIGMYISVSNTPTGENISVREILKNKYSNVKLFGYKTPNEIEYLPSLMDICP
jgi:hypothetical protein